MLKYKFISFINLILPTHHQRSGTPYIAPVLRTQDSVKRGMNMMPFTIALPSNTKFSCCSQAGLHRNQYWIPIEWLLMMVRTNSTIRMTMFMSSIIASRIKFLSEIEYENVRRDQFGDHALMDLEFTPGPSIFAVASLNPIEDLTESTMAPMEVRRTDHWSQYRNYPIQSCPARYGGFYSRQDSRCWIGLNEWTFDALILNEDDRTSFHEARRIPINFSKKQQWLCRWSMVNFVLRHRALGEIGISMLTIVYNQWKTAGTVVDSKRGATRAAIGFKHLSNSKNQHQWREWVKDLVQLSLNAIQRYGSVRPFFFCDVVASDLWMAMWVGSLDGRSQNSEKGNCLDDVWRIAPCNPFRPSGSLVLRLIINICGDAYPRQYTFKNRQHSTPDFQVILIWIVNIVCIATSSSIAFKVNINFRLCVLIFSKWSISSQMYPNQNLLR